MRHRFVACVLAGLAFASKARAEEDPLPALVTRFLEAEGDARAEAASRLLAAKPDPLAVAALLAKGRARTTDVATGWLSLTQRCSDGKERPYLLHVPKAYDPSRRWRLVVDLHGGVSRPEVLTAEDLDGMKFFWGEEAEARGWFLAIPTGQRGAEWWTEVGGSNVLGVVAATRRAYAIDENQVFATGFSDGASGSYWLALTRPTPFAGFVPLNGHLAVAQAGGLQVHLRNLVNRPVFAVNTDLDGLYPAEACRPVAAALEGLGAPHAWHEVKGFGHDPRYLPQERPAILAWMDGVRRDPHPARVAWEGTADAPCRVAWLANARVAPGVGGAELPDPNPDLPPGRPRIGIEIDAAHEGPGVLVKAVSEESPAAAIGVRPGDLVTALDGASIAGMADLRKALSGKKPGDEFALKVRRGDATLDLEGRFAPAMPQPAFDRREPSGALDARRSGNAFEVATRGVASFEVWIGAGAVDLAAPVVVTVNGVEAFRGVVAPDLAFLLERAAADEDPTMLYLSRVEVRVPVSPAK